MWSEVVRRMYEQNVYENDGRYLTPRWRRLRKAVLMRDVFMCQECLRKGVSKQADTIHHIEPDDAELFYDTSNLISVCGACHNTFHNRTTGELTADGKKWARRRKLGLVKKVLS